MPPTPLIPPNPNSGPLAAWPFQGAQSLTNPVTLINGAPLTLQDGQGNSVVMAPSGAVVTNSAGAAVSYTPTGQTVASVVVPGAVHAVGFALDPAQQNARITWKAATGPGDVMDMTLNNDGAAHYHYSYLEFTNGAVGGGENGNALTTHVRLAYVPPTGQGCGGHVELIGYADSTGFGPSGTADNGAFDGSNTLRSVTGWGYTAGNVTVVTLFLRAAGNTFATNSRFTLSYF